jgi:hypothetical protein
MFYPFLSLEDYYDVVSKALQRVSLDEDCGDSTALLTNVLKYMNEDLLSRNTAYLASLSNNSAPVDAALELPFSTDTSSFAGSADELPSASSSAKEYEINYAGVVYFLCVALLAGSFGLTYTLVDCFLAPLPPMEILLDPSLVNNLPSPLTLQVSIPEPSTGTS